MLLFAALEIAAQETNGRALGRVLSDKKRSVAGATVTVIHEPTQSKYVAATRHDGSFYFFNLKPGGPYSIVISSVGLESSRVTNLYIRLGDEHFITGNSELIVFTLKEKVFTLKEVFIRTENYNKNKAGIETNISNQQLLALPSISRNLHDYLRVIPQARVNGDGAISLAGQSPRFNAFFIDGANNQDIQGLSQSGTNGGVTGSPPISIDALEEIKVLLAPYDVQFGNFTGGSVNAVTRSGTNEIKASAWYYFRNQNLSGRSPVPVEKPGAPGVFNYPRLTPFFNQFAGAWLSGPIVKNKLFYFLLFEKQSEVRPQLFDFSEYQGNSNLQQLNALAERLRNYYQYDPGSFLETSDKLNMTRVMFKTDWNPSAKNKFTITYRYNLAHRTAAATSGSTVVAFANSIFFLPTHTHNGTAEWKSFFRHDVSNRFLFSVTNELDDRTWQGKPFPRITINDGSGSIRFGSGPSTMLSIFKATEFNIMDMLRFVKNQHTFTTGVDFNLSRLNDVSIQNYFGSYQFRSLNDFMSGAAPFRLQRSFSLLDQPKGDNTLAAARYKTQRLSVFMNDEITFNTKLKLNIGLRLDCNSLPGQPFEDKFFNDTAIQAISQFHNLKGARAGQLTNADLQFSPRIGFTYKLPRNKITISGGCGIFTGHIVNIWSSLLHFNNGVSIGSIDINPQQYGLNFNPDPYNQPSPHSMGINPANAKGELNLIAKNFKYPAVFRSSLSIAKKVKSGWTFSGEALFTKNIHETRFTNVNLPPSTGTTSSPDKRNVYSINSSPGRISPRYSQIFLLSNNRGQTKGSSYNLAFAVEKQLNPNFYLNGAYGFGKSKVLFETSPGGSSYSLQWAQTETANGKNFASLSTSDVDPGHRVFLNLFKKFTYAKGKSATGISLFYNAQSGPPFSYVYSGSIVNDNGNRENYDLIYIPTVEDLGKMFFITNQEGQTPLQQKGLLNNFIEHDKYLRKNRGKFAERNGARLPFTHIVDLRIQQDFKINIKQKQSTFSILLDIFNFTNMLNKNWGRIYAMSDYKFSLIQFAGYANSATLTPQYQFTPPNGTPHSVESSTIPGNSARWISQLGFRINFN